MKSEYYYDVEERLAETYESRGKKNPKGLPRTLVFDSRCPSSILVLTTVPGEERCQESHTFTRIESQWKRSTGSRFPPRQNLATSTIYP